MQKVHAKHRNNANVDLYEDVEKIKAALWDATQDLKETAGGMLTQSIETVKDKTLEAQENVTHYVTKKPLKSLGAALLTGMVIGYLIHK